MHKKINNVETTAMRFFHKYTPILGIEGEMGWEPTSVRTKCHMLSLWNRILCMDEERITQKIFGSDFLVNNCPIGATKYQIYYHQSI